MSRNIKMEGIVELKGFIKVLGSGLRIGGSTDNIGIGETDNPIIRHPITKLPYIPGSSIKGKIRSLLETQSNAYSPKKPGEPCACGRCLVCQMFGCHDSKNIQRPTRLVFRDCQPSKDTQSMWEESGVTSDIKTEVLIDREKGNAYGRIGPRTTERIPADSDFDFSFSIRFFEGDNLAEYYKYIADGFELLEKHYLGGSGSRGYGQVAFFTEDGETPMGEYLRKKAEEL